MTDIRSQTGVANEALALIGSAQRLSHIDERGKPVADLIRTIWQSTLDFVLADHPWNFAIGLAHLPADAVAPPFGYARSFTLPADCLRWLPWQEDSGHWFKGEQIGHALHSDAEAPLAVRYIRRIDEPALWSTGFAKALAAWLAMQIAEPVAAMTGLESRKASALMDIYKAAKRQDGLATGHRARNSRARAGLLLVRG